MSEKNKAMLKRITNALAKKDKLTHITDKSLLSHPDKMKMALCKHFVEYAVVNKIKTKDLSKKLKIPPSRLSEITNYKIKKYTVDQLMKYLAVLAEHEPKIEAYLNILGQSAELPTMNLTNSKKLTKEIKKYSYSGLSAR